MLPEDVVDVQTAYDQGRSVGYLEGRQAAADALVALASVPSRYAQADWLYKDDGHTRDVLEVWLSAVRAVEAARGDL